MLALVFLLLLFVLLIALAFCVDAVGVCDDDALLLLMLLFIKVLSMRLQL